MMSNHEKKSALPLLVLGSLGVVFGDIGTSPLYTLQECLHSSGTDSASVLGLLSLIFWSLMLVVTFKYVLVLMRADNRGEGGIMALLALVPSKNRQVTGGRIGWATLLVMAGSALLFGDGIITPAISVLSAMEGLGAADAAWKPWIVPLTMATLTVLFLVQQRGTGLLGRLFGPLMALWFLVLGGLGLYNTLAYPGVLWSLSPHHALLFLWQHGRHSFVVLGSVVLAVTGGEALYADMGHFGRQAIRLSWLGMVLPCLLLNYFGQGALVLADPARAGSLLFFQLMPGAGGRYALVVLATAATVIASQAMISAVFSLTQQAIRLGYFPRLTVRHTSHAVEGQIYVPSMNWLLALSCLALVAVFRESGRLAAAYGMAVSGTMVLTSIVFYEVTRRTWNWPEWKARGLLILFLCFDLPFLASTSLKFVDGGYIPFVMGFLVFLTMVIWTRGRSLLREHLLQFEFPLEQLGERARQFEVVQTPNTGVYLTSNPGVAPSMLDLQLNLFRSLPRHMVFLSVTSEPVPFVEEEKRVNIQLLTEGVWSATLACGFMEQPNVPDVMIKLPPEATREVTYFVRRETLLATDSNQMSGWQETIFAYLMRNSQDISLYFNLPHDRVVEMGVRLDL
jgi:KUP system potassium uptake protein